MRIAVTGATGFVGRALLASGHAAGHEMIAVTRAPDAALGAPCRRIRDLSDTDGLRAAFDGAEAVVHLAARVHVMHAEGPEAIARFREVNVEGTRHVLDAARERGVRRLVILSTAKVLGEGAAGEVLRDGMALSPQGAYATSKAEMEQLVGERTDLDCVLLRPPLVYGPGVGGNFRRLLWLADVASVLPLPLGSVNNRRSLVHVGNLAHAALHALSDARSGGRAYLVSDGEDISTADLLRCVGRLGNRRVRLFPCPPAVMSGALRALGRGAEAARVFESFTVDSSAIRRELGWVPPFSLDEGLAGTLRWWRTERRG